MDNCLETFRGLVKNLGEKLKIDGLDLDENNDCYIAFDEKYFVKCSVDVAKEQMNLLAYIGAIPEDNAGYYRGLLESCHFWRDTAGANLSFDPDDATLTLTQYCDMNFMNDEVFYKTMESFVNAMEHWATKRLEEWVNLKEEEAPTGAPGMPMGGMDPNMMMFGA